MTFKCHVWRQDRKLRVNTAFNADVPFQTVFKLFEMSSHSCEYNFQLQDKQLKEQEKE